MDSRWAKAAICAIGLASALPAAVLQTHVLREASTCHRLTPHVIPCRAHLNVEPRHSHRLTPRPLTATEARRTTLRSALALPTGGPAAARPGLPDFSSGPLDPPAQPRQARWVKPPLRAP